MKEQLKPQDLLVALKLIAHAGEPWTFQGLAAALHMSPSEVHGAAKRLERSQLYNRTTDRIVRQHLKEFLVHGVRYAFPAAEGESSRGVPTAWSTAPLFGSSWVRHPPSGRHRNGKMVGNAVPPSTRAHLKQRSAILPARVGSPWLTPFALAVPVNASSPRRKSSGGSREAQRDHGSHRAGRRRFGR